MLTDAIISRSQPEPNTGCWLWLGITNAVNGYGYAPLGERGKRALAHRVSYEAFRGPIPEGMHIDHRCKVRLCVNPDHLEAVTQQENNRRQSHVSHNTFKTECVNGHPFDAENTYHRPTGGRACRACMRERRRTSHVQA